MFGTLGAVLAVTLLSGVPAQAAPPAERLKAQVEKLDGHGGPVAGKGWPDNRLKNSSLPKAVWPSARTARIMANGRASDMPVRATASAGSRLSELNVEILDRAALPRVWRDGLMVRLGAAQGESGAAKVSVDYNSFRYASGGDWASRLKLWQVPSCALTTPERRDCQATPLRTVNDEAAGIAAAEVKVAEQGTSILPRTKAELAGNAAAPTSSGTMVMLAAAASGSSGDFSATNLAPSSTWSAGGSSGTFSWSQPLRTPPTSGGPTPKITLGYSSSSVDGRSEASNNQPSWLGEGFDYSAGYIERRYVSCSEDMKNGAINTQKTPDQCWRSDNATMSLNGGGGELVFETGKGWHSRSENGSKVEKLTGASNGDDNGEYWKVTTTDGTQYFFGRNQLPGQSETTESANTVRVYGNHSGEPCYQSTFANAYCTQVWRWNLDYVVDPRGNTMSYWYAKEWQKYGANSQDTNVVSYVRANALSRIDYGTYYRTTTDHGIAETSVIPTAQVVFTAGDRCVTSCWSGSDPVKENWPDTPHDQDCKMTATSCPGQWSPTFWTTKRLSQVTTKVWDTTKPTAAWQDVDSWTLTHAFPSPGDGTHAGMWLSSLAHTGLVGGTLAEAPITFEPTSLANRVLTGHNTTNNWLRVSNIITETGAKIHVDYSLPECTDSNKPSSPHTNTMRCYPVLVADPNDSSGNTLIPEWWHKYVVTHVAEDDVPLADGRQAVSKHTWYEYVGAPAWHYADDDGLSKPDRKTWGQFRGYATVKTRVGDNAATQTLKVTNYLRGMHADRSSPSGGTTNVMVGASIGSETVYDEDQFSGMVREEVVYNGTEDKPVSRKVNVPWRSDPPTATRTINGDTVAARYTSTAVTYDSVALGVDGARGWRTTRGRQDFESTYGSTNWSQNDGDIAMTGDEKCVKYVYNRNTVKNIVTTVKQSTTTALTCDKTPISVDDVMSDERNYYDGASSVDAAPLYGSVTKLDKLKDWVSGTGTVWQTVSQNTFDTSGRPRVVTDAKGNTSTNAYTPAVGGPITRIAKTTGPSPFVWTSNVDTNPYWGSVTKSTDVNGKVTGEAVYDALGRVAKVWNLGWSKAANPNTPSTEYTYSMSASKTTYPYITTKTLNAKGNYVTAYQILDGWLRERQTQTISLNGDGSRVVVDAITDGFGRTAVGYSPHAEPGAPSGTLWWEPEWSVPSITRTEYDRAGRVTASVFLAGDGVTNLVEKYRSTTIYEGDLTKSTPPQGGIATTTVTDSDGKTVGLRQHTTAAGVGGAYQETKFEFNRKGQAWKTIDPAGNEWVYTFDAKGRQTSVKDPDKGTTLSQYNDFDEVEKTTDSRGKVLWYVYDQIGRKKELRDNSAMGALRTEWKYDALYSGQTGFRGQLTQSIRYEPAGSANAYKWQARSLNGRYQPGGANVVIPAVETGLDATYVYSYSYSSYTGAPTSTTYPGAGDVPGEMVTTDYDSVTGMPVRLDTNWINQTGTMLATWYTAYGEQSQTTRKLPGGVYVDDVVTYDDFDRRVKRTTVKPETTAGTVSDRNYYYDKAGNITSVEETPQVGSADTQCYRINWLNQLNSAWTPKAGVSCGTDPAVSNLGGPAPYWMEWTFDSTGSRKTEASHAAAGKTTRTYNFPAGGANVVRPHAVTSMKTSAPGVSDVTVNYQHDIAGNTACRPSGSAANTCPTGAGSQELLWNAEGKLETVKVGGSAVETNVYDASGNRLVRRDSTGTTVYLPGQEIRREGTVNKGTRYYSFGGTTCASRNGSGVTWLYSDHQGTQQISVKADTQVATVRRQTPYGGSRGSAVAWANQKGFVGGDNDPTGLVNIGARQYDPTLGRFISVDPLLVANDPAQYNAYQYGAGNPISNSDPTGMGIDCGGGTGTYSCSNNVPKANGKGWFKGESSNTEATPEEIEHWRKIAEAQRKKRECEADFWCRQGQKLKDAGNAAMNWAVEHADVVGTVAGIVVGVGCTALTGGGGAILCGAIGGAVSGLVSGALKCKGGDESHCGAGNMLIDVGLGAGLGALGGAGGAVLGGALRGAAAGAATGLSFGMRAAVSWAARGLASGAAKEASLLGAGTKAAAGYFGKSMFKEFVSGSIRSIGKDVAEMGGMRTAATIGGQIIRGMGNLKNGVGPAAVGGATPGSRDDIKDIANEGWQFKWGNSVGPALGGAFG